MPLHLVPKPGLPENACPKCGHVHTADDRCHPYNADYCPLCGTAAQIGKA